MVKTFVNGGPVLAILVKKIHGLVLGLPSSWQKVS